MSELNLLPQQMMPAAIGNPPCTSNPVVTAVVFQPLAVEMKRMRAELNGEPLDLPRVEHVRAAVEALSNLEVVEKCTTLPQLRASVILPEEGLA